MEEKRWHAKKGDGENVQTEHRAWIGLKRKRITRIVTLRGLTPEYVRWTITGASLAEGYFPMAGGSVIGRAYASSTLPGGMTFRAAISTTLDPQGSSRVDILPHLYTTAACAAGNVTVTIDRDGSRCRSHEG